VKTPVRLWVFLGLLAGQAVVRISAERMSKSSNSTRARSMA
jgi:hypothetical protein